MLETTSADALTTDALDAVASVLRRSTVEVRSGASGGAGVVWPADRDNPYGGAIVVTNAHVIGRSQPAVATAAGRIALVSTVIVHHARDLALLVVPDLAAPPVTIGDTSALRAGELVLAFGHPFGVPLALAVGVLHDAPLASAGNATPWLRADVRLAPGNSGGPLADARGHVIGINTMIAAGLALAIPAPIVEHFVARAVRSRAA